jgi:uncharacterized Zn finger protein
MCKHVAAVLYGIGARLDEQPELLFKLRKVDEKDLIAKAGKGLPLSKKGPAEEKVLAADGLSELFGLEMGTATEEPPPDAVPTSTKPARARRAPKPRSEPANVAAHAKTAARRSSANTKKKARKAKAKPTTRTKKSKTPKR